MIVADQAGRRRDTGSRPWRSAGQRELSPKAKRRMARDLLWWRLRHESGFTVQQIATMYDVDRRTVYRRLQALEDSDDARRLGQDP